MGETCVHHTIMQSIVARAHLQDFEGENSIDRRMVMVTGIRCHWTVEADHPFHFLRIVDPVPIFVTIEAEDAGVEAVVHSEGEVQEGQNLEEVAANMAEAFHHRFAIGMAENQTRYRRTTETKVLVGIVGQKTMSIISIPQPFPGENNTNANHSLVFPHIANLPRTNKHQQKAGHLLLPLRENQILQRLWRKQNRQIPRQRRNLPQNRNLHQDQRNHRRHRRANQPVLCLRWLACWSWKHPWNTPTPNMFC